MPFFRFILIIFENHKIRIAERFWRIDFMPFDSCGGSQFFTLFDCALSLRLHMKLVENMEAVLRPLPWGPKN